MSGALVVPSLADRLGLPFVLVRQRGTSRHWHEYLGLKATKLIFVDDLIDTGATFRRVRDEFEDVLHADSSKVVGIILHQKEYRYKVEHYLLTPEEKVVFPTADALYENVPVWFA